MEDRRKGLMGVDGGVSVEEEVGRMKREKCCGEEGSIRRVNETEECPE